MVKKGQELRCADSRHRCRRSAVSRSVTSSSTPNPWEEFTDEYRVGQETEGKIVRIIDKGVVVELPHGVDGFVPTSQLAFAPVKNIASYFRVGDNLPLKVIEFDKDAKKIVLSVVEALKAKGQDAQEEYYRLHPVPQSAPAGMVIDDVPVPASEATAEMPAADDAGGTPAAEPKHRRQKRAAASEAEASGRERSDREAQAGRSLRQLMLRKMRAIRQPCERDEAC